MARVEGVLRLLHKASIVLVHTFVVVGLRLSIVSPDEVGLARIVNVRVLPRPEVHRIEAQHGHGRKIEWRLKDVSTSRVHAWLNISAICAVELADHCHFLRSNAVIRRLLLLLQLFQFGCLVDLLKAI